MIYRGDDTRAFGGKPLKIILKNSENLTITKADFRCGKIIKTFTNPKFPLEVWLTSAETSLLRSENVCYLAIYDEYGYKKTCNGEFKFNSQKGIV